MWWYAKSSLYNMGKHLGIGYTIYVDASITIYVYRRDYVYSYAWSNIMYTLQTLHKKLEKLLLALASATPLIHTYNIMYLSIILQ